MGLCAASGLNNNPKRAKCLLEASANPNGASLYHSTEHPDRAWFKLLPKRGVKIEGTNALKPSLDHERFEG